MMPKSHKNMTKKEMDKLDKKMKPYTFEQRMAKMKHEQGESAKKRVMEAGTANGGRMNYSTSRKAY